MTSATRIEWQPSGTPDVVLIAQFASRGPLVEHQLGVRHGAQETMGLHSHQAEPIGDWPLSPPLQSFQLTEDGEGRPLMLATGLAGKSHWSLAVSVRGESLLFDVACRTGAAPVFLGSTYRLGTATAAQQGGTEVSLSLPGASHRGRLSLVGDPGLASGLRFEEADTPAVVIHPLEQPLEAGNTVRWAYAWSCEPT